MGKSTISMAIFNCYVSSQEGNQELFPAINQNHISIDMQCVDFHKVNIWQAMSNLVAMVFQNPIYMCDVGTISIEFDDFLMKLETHEIRSFPSEPWLIEGGESKRKGKHQGRKMKIQMGWLETIEYAICTGCRWATHLWVYDLDLDTVKNQHTHTHTR